MIHPFRLDQFLLDFDVVLFTNRFYSPVKAHIVWIFTDLRSEVKIWCVVSPQGGISIALMSNATLRKVQCLKPQNNLNVLTCSPYFPPFVTWKTLSNLLETPFSLNFISTMKNGPKFFMWYAATPFIGANCVRRS